MIIYKYAPDLHGETWRHTVPGAVIATVLMGVCFSGAEDLPAFLQFVPRNLWLAWRRDTPPFVVLPQWRRTFDWR